MFLHAFNTWLVANLMLSVFMFFLSGDAGGEWIPAYDMHFYFMGLVFLFIVSIPLLMAAWIMIHFIRNMNLSSGTKYSIWILLTTILPPAEWIIFYLLYSRSEIYPEEPEIILPASAAVLISVLIRHKQFFKLFNQPHSSTSE